MGAGIHQRYGHRVLPSSQGRGNKKRLGGDLRKPLLALGRLREFHVVDPKSTGAFEPELEPARARGHVEVGTEKKLEPLPSRAGPERVGGAGVFPRT